LAKGAIVIDGALCKECHLCIEFCNRKCIEPGSEYNDRGFRPVRDNGNGQCNGCTLCAIICPEIAIEVYRE
jgi:2-oxoglutarate ferredoxin oxidoreductase subunit delta